MLYSTFPFFMRKLVSTFTALSVALLPLLSSADGTDLSLPENHGKKNGKIANQYIVVLKDNADVDSDSEMLVKNHKGVMLFTYKNALKGFAATLSSEEIASLKKHPKVADVVQDEEVTIDAKSGPVIQAQTLPTGIDRVNAENKTNKGTNIEIAVIDTGIQGSHPDLAGAVLGGISCVKGEKPNDDGNGHGTHVAGTIGARSNAIGAVGVAPEAKLWAVKVLNRQGAGSWSSVICGIDWVTSQASHIKVANMSLGGTGSAGADCNSSPLRKAICNSVNAGVTYVVAAGNEADDVKNHVPAAFPEVIAVSALADSNGRACADGVATGYGTDDTFASFSNFATQGSDLSRLIGAPGVSIFSTWKGSSYNTISGTSMASPHVAGAAALYIKTHPGATPANVKAGLLALAEPGDVNFNTECAGTAKSHLGGTLHPEPLLRAESL
jgi:subtilisin family serine protease